MPNKYEAAHGKIVNLSFSQCLGLSYLSTCTMFSTGRDIATITQLEVKCLLFFQGSETNYPTIFCLC